MARTHVTTSAETITIGDLRRDLALQLHNGPIQQLSACVLRLETFRLASASREMQDAITDVEENVRAAVASLRDIVRDLSDGPAR